MWTRPSARRDEVLVAVPNADAFSWRLSTSQHMSICRSQEHGPARQAEREDRGRAI